MGISWLLLLHFLSIFFGIHTVSVDGQCLDDQNSLLIQLKQSISFYPFASATSKLTSWNSNIDCCSWEGVICDRDVGHVIGLDLSSESISGGFDNSSSLFNLQYLQSLNLANNNFNSIGIPSEFGQLVNLTNLNLSNSGFAGQIPIEISRLTRLVSLDLSSTFSFDLKLLKLEHPDLGTLFQNLSGLRILQLDGVNISARGSEWCKSLASALPNLQVLSLTDCYLSGSFDSSLLKLLSLSELRLDRNIFAGVPEFFANFSSLTTLRLGSCGLNGEFPKKIFQLTTLRTLDLSNNPHLHGSLPEFPRNASLQNLVLYSTSFSGNLPDSIGYLRFLSRLELSRCGFNGSIPHSLANLTQLLILDLSSNRFTGPIPSFGWSENLNQINLANNHLTGPIPSFQCDRLQKLENLDLRNNSLTGNIPLPLFTLPSLRKLQLALNQFTGQLGEFPNASSSLLLEALDLSSNKLEGPIPMSVFELRRLKILTLSFNNFNGTVHLDLILKLGNLSSLDLSYNKLLVNTSVNSNQLSLPKISTLSLASCKLRVFPDFLRVNQSNLSYLDLSNNQIHGTIPNWIWNTGNWSLVHLNLSCNYLEDLERPLPNLSSSSLAFLDLHSNQLKGPLPMLPPYATYLDYSRNNFTSVIPANIDSYLIVTIFFSLSDNKLIGEIPRSICDATYLQVLNLSNNSLSGPIPSCLGDMGRTLGVLNLGGNNFHGVMPQQSPHGCRLRTLNLNRNMLEGQVSRTLANCTMLEVLDIGNNQISDTFPSWLVSLPQLRVLVLRSNKFYGPILPQGTNCTFQMLQIIDLSSNDFTGNLPSECFLGWREMMVSEDETQSKLKNDILRYGGFLDFSHLYYQDSVTVTSKGLDMELVKILTIFTSIDFSNNMLQGEIPEVIGNLTSLYSLNLSNNDLTGQIPPSMGNLKQLESLDLSQNELSGMIPKQLASLTFLSVLNLSWNNLMGRIPGGNQFQTFNDASFQGNVGLCGPPLSTTCTDDKAPPSPMSPFDPIDSESATDFVWKFMLIGFGIGGGTGMAVGFLVFRKRGRKWYV